MGSSGRKVGGRLNFDSVVSDSLVARSLANPQNGCSAGSCTTDAAPPDPSVKAEQADS